MTSSPTPTRALRTFTFFSLILAIGVSICLGKPVESLPDKRSFHLFLLAGQSNMAGRGTLDEEAEKTNPKILALNQEGEWVVAKDPIHWDKPFAGVGLAKSFAEAYLADHPGVTVGFIPAACGGSPVSAWKPGVYFDQTDSHPYDDAKARTAIATQAGILKGILWHQGESDSHEGLAEAYKENLSELLARFRSEIASRDTPIVLGQLGQFSQWGAPNLAVDKAIQEVAAETDRVAFVSSDDLTAKEDNIHFNTQSLREFGRRYYEAYKSVAD